MLKTIIAASAAMIAVPAMAQDVQTAPATSAEATQATPATAAPQDAMTASPAPEGSATAATQPAPAQTAEAAPASGAQIAQIVEQDFPKYDTAAKGSLDQKQFGKWMTSLRATSEPGAKPESAEMKAWVAKAFASADTDRSKSVSKAELTAFLSQGA